MEGNLFKSIGLGLLGGLAGMMAMRVTMKATRRFVGQPDPLARRDNRSMSLIGINHRDDEPATEALARTVYSKIRGREPDDRQRAILGQAVHYGFGLSMAGLYAALRGRRVDSPDIIGGALFGAALWAVADELIIPLLGLADKPTRYPVSSHAQALAGHVAFGVTTGSVVGALRKGIPSNGA